MIFLGFLKKSIMMNSINFTKTFRIPIYFEDFGELIHLFRAAREMNQFISRLRRVPKNVAAGCIGFLMKKVSEHFCPDPIN